MTEPFGEILKLYEVDYIYDVSLVEKGNEIYVVATCVKNRHGEPGGEHIKLVLESSAHVLYRIGGKNEYRTNP